jgi:ribosomal protein L16 Arg81 hydroxylase
VLRKYESVMANLAALQSQQSRSVPIDRRDAVSTDEFLERYYLGSRPLVLTALAKGWPALERWTFDYLDAHFGDALVEIQAGRDSDPDYEMNSIRHKREVRLRDFLADVRSGRAGNDRYLTANNHALKRPELARLLDDVGTLPNWFDRRRLANEALLWIGGTGVTTPLHHDTVQLMHTHILGRKRWRLISPLQTPLLYNHVGVFSPVRLEQPDLGRYPKVAQARVIDVVLEPGETLFLPVGWWHHVQTLDLCISLSFTNFAFPNQFSFDNPDQRSW